MNKKQAAKVELIKKALMAVSFDGIGDAYWTTAMYKRNGDVVFEGDLLFMESEDKAWTLTGGSHGLLVLSHGDVRHTIGFILEYSTSQADVMAQAIEIDKKVRAKIA